MCYARGQSPTSRAENAFNASLLARTSRWWPDREGRLPTRPAYLPNGAKESVGPNRKQYDSKEVQARRKAVPGCAEWTHDYQEGTVFGMIRFS